MKNFHVISHTHWDREWYQTFEEFRRRLVDLIDRLFEIYSEYPEYVFHLDAQTICLEDYLEYRPSRRGDLKELIRSGRLIVGPWYVQNDFFLTSGESTVRNLLIGSALARDFGGCDLVGYAPDQFGLIGQLPQIFGGFGIDCCIFGRGYQRFRRDDEGKLVPLPQPNEFYWVAPDGSRVLASFLNRWYNNAQRFSADPELAYCFFQQVAIAQDDCAVTSHRLLMNGVDHLEAQEDILPVLAGIATRLPKNETVRQSTLRAYINGVRDEAKERGIALSTVSGELREGTSGNILQGTMSAWTPLKRENVRAQSLLEQRLEPLYSMLVLLTGDEKLYDLDGFRYLWKSLLKNHPHDSICGCSRDRVHEDNLNRFASLRDASCDLLRRGMVTLFNRLDRSGMCSCDYLLTVFNPRPAVFSAVVPAKLYLPLDEQIDSIRIVDSSGREIDFVVTGTTRRFLAIFPAINLPGKTSCSEVDILFSAEDLPALGYRVYTVKPHLGQRLLAPEPVANQSAGGLKLENEFIRLQISPEGRVDLHDLNSQKDYPDLITFTDEADIGHSYNFFPAPTPDILDLPAFSEIEVEMLSDSALRQEARVTYRFDLPREYDFPHRTRCCDKVPIKLEVIYSLDRFARNVELEVTVDNAAFEHRLRAVFRTGIATDITSASVPFGFETRSRCRAHDGIKHNGDQPNSGIVSLSGDRRDFTLFSEGLFEYEHLDGGSLALTLLRSVRRITNGDFPNQQDFMAEAYEWESPGTGLPGSHSFRLALRPGPASSAEQEAEFRAFLSPPFCGFDSVDERKFTSGRPCDQDTAVRELFFRPLPREKRTLMTEATGLMLTGSGVLSALKRAEDGCGMVLRLYNPSGVVVPIQLDLPPQVRRIVRIEMDERREMENVDWCGGPLSLSLSPWGIVTLRLLLD